MSTTIESPIYFDGIDINTIAGWTTTGTDTYSYPTRNLKTYAVEQSNKTVTTSGFYGGRGARVTGHIAVSGRELLDDAISELRRLLRPLNADLQLPVSSGQRVFYGATVGNVMYTEALGGFIEVDIRFILSDPFSYSLVTTEVLNVANLTSGIKSYPITFEGTAMQAPIFTYTVDSVTGGDYTNVTFANPVGDSITISSAFAAADVLVIDCKESAVTLNGQPIDFTGKFPEWDKGGGFINYSDDFTARQVDINVVYQKRYE